VEGHVNCGDVQVERGAVLAGGIFSVYSAAAQVKPVNDNRPAKRSGVRYCRGNRSADED
jgi:hypothetical protein